VPQDFVSADLLQQLDRLKVPTFMLRAASLEDVFEQIQIIARIFERQQAGDELVSVMRQRVALVREQVRSRPRPRVLYVLNSDPLQSAGPGSFIHQLIEIAGGLNIAAEAGASYPRLSLEEVIARNPEYLVFPAGADEGIPDEERDQWRRWPSLEAVKHNRLVSVPSTLVDRPGPRLVEGLERLARAIHPEVAPLLSLGKSP
jgi:iron complex transport system substrate-binding protein